MPKAPKAKTSYTLPDLIRAPCALGFSSPKSREDSEIQFFFSGNLHYPQTLDRPDLYKTCAKLLEDHALVLPGSSTKQKLLKTWIKQINSLYFFQLV